MKKAIEVMNKPITITKDSSLFEAIKKLVDYKISRVAVLDEGKPVGIITEKDIGIFLYSDKTFQSLEQIPVTELMRTSLLYDGSQTLKECAAIMIEKEVGSLLIGTKEKLKGILTKTDIVNYLGEQYFGKHKVVDLKNPGFVFTLEGAPLSHVLKKMIQNNISRIVVANNSGKLTGIITFRDFFEISLQLGSDI
ncbi:MAG: CBS domain-containing protein, partial [Nitrosopumilaceae archaeon]